MKAAIYIRVSSDEQVSETNGLYNQIKKCHSYAQEKGYTLVGNRYGDLSSGMEVVKNGQGWEFAYPKKAEKENAQNIVPIPCYVEDFSGKYVSRPTLDILRDFVEYEGLDVLVVRDTQRFARPSRDETGDPHVALYLKDWFRKMGVTIDYATQEFEDNAAGHAQEGICELFDGWQAEELREKAIRGRRDSARLGRVVLPQPPYGYQKVGKGKDVRLEIHPVHSETVKQIFTWYVLGDGNDKRLSISGIAKKLTSLRVPTSWDLLGKKKKKGYGVWSQSSVRTILKNSVYIGVWCYGKTKRVHERIVENAEGRREIKKVKSADKVPRSQWIEVEVPPILERVLKVMLSTFTSRQRHSVQDVGA